MLFKKLFYSVAFSSCLVSSVFAQSYEQSAAAQAFIAEMEAEHGFIAETLQSVFSDAQRQQAILDAIARPAERVKPWKEYRPIFITSQRSEQGLKFWNKNADALARAEQEYGVPAEYIVAIIGVETMYGDNTGKYRVIDALSTLAFDYPPRAPFFRKELKEFLLLAREEQVNPLELKGSYAGAMGMAQFMPSSFRAYAVDFDHDGHINIWSNPTDAIGSVANYFAKHKWQKGQMVTVQASVSGSKVAQGLSVKIDDQFTVKQLKKLGWTPATNLPDDLKVTTFKLEGEKGDEYWIGLNNFQTITRYNRSVMYAMAVHELAQQMKQARKG